MGRLQHRSVSWFPVRASIAVCRAINIASPLFKPDVRISRIRLSRDHFAKRHTLHFGNFAQWLSNANREENVSSVTGHSPKRIFLSFCMHVLGTGPSLGRHYPESTLL